MISEQALLISERKYRQKQLGLRLANQGHQLHQLEIKTQSVKELLEASTERRFFQATVCYYWRWIL